MSANYTTVRYELSAEGSGTQLNVTQGDFAGVENGAKRYEETVGAWVATLKALKKLLEVTN